MRDATGRQPLPNLKNVNHVGGASLQPEERLDLVARLSVITGVSGSGKSTLAREVLHENLQALVAARNMKKERQRSPAANR